MRTLSRRAWWWPHHLPQPPEAALREAQNPSGRRQVVGWISGLYAVLLLAVSVVPTPEGPSVPHLDKLVHLGEYFLFAWLLVQALPPTRLVGGQVVRHYQIWVWLYATSYGVLIELIQLMVPWRSGDVVDAVMNGLGAAAGVWVAPPPAAAAKGGTARSAGPFGSAASGGVAQHRTPARP